MARRREARPAQAWPIRALKVTVLPGLLALSPAPALAWPAELTQSLARDARRLLPPSLARLIAEREREVLEAAQHYSPDLDRIVAADLSSGRLQPETASALDARAAAALSLLKQRRTNEGLVDLGALLRIAADLSDPVLCVGPQGYPPGVVAEYYAFVRASLDKIPVVIDDPQALKLGRRDLPGYWQRLLARSRSQSDVIRDELFRNGRAVSHRTLDYRSPVFGVASLSYSRAVTGIAATWLAYWREARGDITRMPRPSQVSPADRPASAASPRVPILPEVTRP